MPAERGENSTRGDEETHFADTLGSLKQRGSALLVVGAVPEEMYVRASRQMMGDPNAANPRRRLLVGTDFTPERAAERLRDTGPFAPEFARVVTHESDARSATAVSASGEAVASPSGPGAERPSAAPRIHGVGGSFAEVGKTFSEVVSQFDVAAGGLGPAELRVAFDCLPTFLSRFDAAAVFEFVHIVTNHVRLYDGMAHFRLGRDRDDRTVLTFQSLFDAVIELRVDGDDLMQRWHVPGDDFVSEWLDVP